MTQRIFQENNLYVTVDYNPIILIQVSLKSSQKYIFEGLNAKNVNFMLTSKEALNATKKFSAKQSLCDST